MAMDNLADSLSSCSSQAEEECLRPSLIRRKIHLFFDATNLASPPATRSSPLQDIVALASPAPSCSDRPASVCFSSNAETNLFGSPVPSACTPPGRHQQCSYSIAAQSPSLQQLQKQHTALLQNLNDYKAYQTKMEAYLQDRAFLTKQLLRVNSNSSQSAALFDLRQVEQNMQTDAAYFDSSVQEQQRTSSSKDKELWQQLSFASDESGDANEQMQDLQAELTDCKQQLTRKEAAAARLQGQLLDTQSQLASMTQQFNSLEQDKVQISQTAAMTESSLMEQLEAVQQQHQQAVQVLQLQHRQVLESLQCCSTSTVSAMEGHVTEAHAKCQQLEVAEQQHLKAMQELQMHNAETESGLLDRMQEVQQQSAAREFDLLAQLQQAQQAVQEVAELRAKVQSVEHDNAQMADMAALTESALMDDLELARQQHHEETQQLQASVQAAHAALSQQVQKAELAAEQAASMQAQLPQFQQDKAEIAQQAAATESSLMDQLESKQQQQQQQQQQHQRDLQALHISQAQTESAVKDQLTATQEKCTQLADQLLQRVSAVSSDQPVQHSQQAQDLVENTMREELPNQDLAAVTAQLAALQAGPRTMQASTETFLADQLAQAQQELSTVTAQLAAEQAAHAQPYASAVKELIDQLAQVQQDLVEVQAQLTASQAAESELLREVKQAQQANARQADSHTKTESSLMEQLATVRQELAAVTAHVTSIQTTQVDDTRLVRMLQPQADDGAIRQALAQAQQDLATVTAALAASQTAQSGLAQELEMATLANAELADAHTLTEADLLEQLHETQAEQLRLEIHVRHLEDRHSEINRLLIFARSGQAAAGRSEADLTKQLNQAKQDAENLRDMLFQSQKAATGVPALHAELKGLKEQGDKAAVHSAELAEKLQQAEAKASSQQQALTAIDAKLKKYKACYRDVKKQLDTAKSQAASAEQNEQQSHASHQHRLDEQLENATVSDQSWLAARAALDSTTNQLQQLQDEVKALQSQLLSSDALLQSSKAETAAVTDQLEPLQSDFDALQSQLAHSTSLLQSSQAETVAAAGQLTSAQQELAATKGQLAQTEETLKHVSLDLGAANCSTSAAEQKAEQQTSGILTLQNELSSIMQQLKDSQQLCQRLSQHLRDNEQEQQVHVQQVQQLRNNQQEHQQQKLELQQLRDSRHEQSQLIQDLQLQVQHAAGQLERQQQSSAQLSCELAEAQHAQQAATAELQGLCDAQSEMEGRTAEGSLLIQELRIHLAAAQAHMLSQQARLQAQEREAETLTGDLQRASRSLAHVLHQQDTSLPTAVIRFESNCSGSGLQEAAEQVCGLAEGLLLHYAMLQTLPAPAIGGSKPQPMQARHINKPEDSLSSHVAAAQARANHIVEEFESMLLVTGGHSAKEIQAIQSQAGLGVSEQSKPVHSQGRFTRLTPARSDMSAQALNVPVKKGGIQQTSVDCACGLSSSSHSSIDVGKKDAAGTSSRTSAKTSSRKSTVKALKENKAPSLTYVSGSQVRGARRPHDFVSKHVLKPRVTDNHRATEQRHVAISTHLAYTSRSHNTTCL